MQIYTDIFWRVYVTVLYSLMHSSSHFLRQFQSPHQPTQPTITHFELHLAKRNCLYITCLEDAAECIYPSRHLFNSILLQPTFFSLLFSNHTI